MTRFALLTFWRSLTRHRLYALLNVGGLALGIAVFLVLLVYVRFETGYDRFLPNWRHLYLIESANVPVDAKGYAQGAPTALWSAARRELPGVSGARMLERSATVEHSGVGTAETFALVDPNLPKVLGIVPTRGTLGDLRDPTRLVLTERTARKYFGEADPIGRGLTIKVQGVARNFGVAAVIPDWPANSDIDFDLLAPLVVTDDPRSPDWGEEHSWQWWNARTYVSLANAEEVARFASDLKDVVARHARHDTPDGAEVRIQHRLRPIGDLHFEAPGRALAVTTLGVVGLLTLLVAAVNYVNLATARSGLRAREVAMRKVFGADQRTLLIHYMLEAIATAAIAAIIGAAVAELAMPVLDAAIGLNLKLRYFGSEGVALPLILATLAIGVVAGLYPALVLSRFPVAAVLASARSPGGGRGGARVRSVLVVFQFGIAVAFVIATMAMGAQVAHVRAAEVGFRREQLMLVPSLARSDLDVARRGTVLHRLEALPQVSAITVSDTVPGPGAFHANTFLARAGQPGSNKTFSLANVAPHYFETLGAHLVAGRWFDGTHPGDVDANYRADFAPSTVVRPVNIVINRAGARVLGFADPRSAIGKDVAAAGDPPTMIVGVIDDMRFGGARDPVPPTAYHYVATAPGNGIAIVRYRGDTAAMAAAVGSVWLASAPSVPLKVLTAAANQEVYNRADDHSARLLGVGALLAVAIGCVGLWGLASFNTARRIKEIGIRKTLGASSMDIVRLLLSQLLRPVLLANLVAWPLAYAAMRVWLAGFDDRISLSPLFFAAATLLALVVALVTVLAQSLRASRATPAWALRRE